MPRKTRARTVGRRGAGRCAVALVAAVSLAATVGVAPGRAAPPSQPRLSKFRPVVVTDELYAVQEPKVDPSLQQRTITMRDGVRLFVDVWLPGATEGRVPPVRVPTIVSFTPYVTACR